MFHVRYYSRKFHPDEFRGTALGWVIRVLNRARWGLEVLVQRLTLYWLAEKEGISPEKRGVLTRLFEADVVEEQAQEVRTSPLSSPLVKVVEQPVTEDRSARYVNSMTGRLRVFPSGESQPVRPKPLTDLIERYAGDAKRRRYVGSGGYVTPDDEFEPVEKEVK